MLAMVAQSAKVSTPINYIGLCVMATKYNIYEIYVKDIITGESGADLKSIIALNREDAADYPFFDEVVMYEGTMGEDSFAVLNSGLPMTRSVRKSVLGK